LATARRPTSLGAILASIVCTLAGAAWYLHHELAVGPLGFPLDDGWIHAQFATRLAAGQGLAFNAGEPCAGSTSPLWTLLLGMAVATGSDVVFGAKALGTLSTAVAAGLGAVLAARIAEARSAAWVAGLSIALSPRLTWASVSGMEVSLATALLLATLLAYLHAGHRSGRWGLLAGLAGVARPEVLPLILVLLVHRWIFRLPAIDAPGSVALRESAWALGGFGVVFALYAGLNLYGGGTILPTTFSAKTTAQGLLYAVASLEGREFVRSLTTRPVEHLSLLARFFFDQSQILCAALFVGIPASVGGLRGVSAGTGGGLVIATVAVTGFLMGALAPDVPLYGQEGRYVLPFVVLLFVLSGVGLSALRRLAPHPWWVTSLIVVALARLASQDVQFAPRYAAQVANINALQVAMGRWVADHTPVDAVVATNDIGAIGYVSQRRILDTEGLITPAILPFKRDRRHLAFLEAARPDLLIIFPEWYPQLASRPDLFQEVHRITVPRVTAAHDTLVAYRTPWTRPAVLMHLAVRPTP